MAIYRTFATYDNSTTANIRGWGQSFGQAMLNFGWVAQTGHGEVVATNVSGTWTWTTNPVTPTAATTTPRSTAYNFRSAFSTANLYAINDVVTSAGLTFVATAVTPVLVLTSVATGTGVYTGTITGGGANAFAGHSFTIAGFTTGANNGTFACTASTTTTLTLNNSSSVSETHAATATDVTVPASNLLTWQPLNFEIFASAGSMTSALPLYIKIVYGNINSNAPAVYVAVGTGVDVSGNLTGAPNLITGNAMGQWAVGVNGNTGTSLQMSFSGDSDNFRMCPFNNIVAQTGNASSAGPLVLVVDRAKTSTGADADGFAYVGFIGQSGGGSAYCISAIILKSTIGGIVGQTLQGQWLGTLATPVGSLGNWGSSPPMPILPLVGYTGNPLLGAITVQASDWSAGAVLPLWLYGAAHNYLVCGSDTTLTNYRQLNGLINTVVAAIRWE